MKTFAHLGQAHSYRFLRRRLGSLSEVFVCVNIFAFLVLSFLHWLQALTWQQSYSLFGLSRTGILERHWFFQFVSSPFVHGSVIHLAFNMLALWMLGPSLERVLGRKRYLFLSLLCTLAASAGFLTFSTGRGAILIGYSSIIFGILAAHAVLFPNTVLVVFGFFPLKMKHAAVLLGAIELYLTLASPYSTTAHAAHVLGAIAGFAYLIFLRAYARSRPDPSRPTKSFRVKEIKKRYQDGIPHEL